MTSERLWTKYNKLANELRESITTLALSIVGVWSIDFIFEDYELDEVQAVWGNYNIVGLVLMEKELRVIVENEIFSREVWSLYSENLHLPDLLFIQEQLENYENNRALQNKKDV